MEYVKENRELGIIERYFCKRIFVIAVGKKRARGSVVVKALYHNPEGRGF
jgi:hypothetical protein